MLACWFFLFHSLKNERTAAEHSKKVAGIWQCLDGPAAGRLDAELLSVTKRVTNVLQMLPKNITPVNLEELRRVKQQLVELESRAENIACVSSACDYMSCAVSLAYQLQPIVLRESTCMHACRVLLESRAENIVCGNSACDSLTHCAVPCNSACFPASTSYCEWNQHGMHPYHVLLETCQSACMTAARDRGW